MRRENEACQNTDKEIWRERPDDYYADSIHVTIGGGIGLNCGGTVIVLPIRTWHCLAALSTAGSDCPALPLLSANNNEILAWFTQNYDAIRKALER
jgi:hypothetical protein